MSGSLGKSESSSDPSSVWSAQSPYLQALYDSAFRTMGGGFTPVNPRQMIPGRTYFASPNGPMQMSINPQDPSGQAYNYAQNVAGGAMGGYQNQMQGGFSDPTLYQNLYGLGGGQYQNQALGGAIQAGLGDINRNLQRNILPSVNTGSALTNTSGGSRQGIAQGLAMSDANRQAGDFVNRMYSQNYGQTLQSMLGANQQLAGLQAGLR